MLFLSFPNQSFSRRDSRLSTKTPVLHHAAIQKPELTFSGNTFSMPQGGSTRYCSHHSDLKAENGEDFDKYWKGQGLHKNQIEQMKKQALKHKSARYIKGTDTYSPNFMTNLHRTRRGLPPERPGTPHEQKMLASQRAQLSKEPQRNVQSFLARLYLYCTHRLQPTNNRTMRDDVTRYAVPLWPGKALYRGMLLTPAQLKMIVANAEGDEANQWRTCLKVSEQQPPYTELAKHLLHGFPKGKGNFSHHGITSVSTRPSIAAEYARRSFKDMQHKAWHSDRKKSLLNNLTGRAYIPVFVTIVSHPEYPARGFVIEKNYYKPKHEIILDSTNTYQLDENPLGYRNGMVQLRVIAGHQP